MGGTREPQDIVLRELAEDNSNREFLRHAPGVIETPHPRDNAAGGINHAHQLEIVRTEEILTALTFLLAMVTMPYAVEPTRTSAYHESFVAHTAICVAQIARLLIIMPVALEMKNYCMVITMFSCFMGCTFTGVLLVFISNGLTELFLGTRILIYIYLSVCICRCVVWELYAGFMVASCRGRPSTRPLCGASELYKSLVERMYLDYRFSCARGRIPDLQVIMSNVGEPGEDDENHFCCVCLNRHFNGDQLRLLYCDRCKNCICVQCAHSHSTQKKLSASCPTCRKRWWSPLAARR